MMRLLQSLDGNFNPDDGISLREIPPETIARHYPDGINELTFDKSLSDFENEPNLSKFLFEVGAAPALRDLGHSIGHFEEQMRLLAQNGYEDPRGAFPLQQTELTTRGTWQLGTTPNKDDCFNPYMVSSPFARSQHSMSGTGLRPYIRPV